MSFGRVAATLLAVTWACGPPAPDPRPDDSPEPAVFRAEPIAIDRDLRLRRGFDYATFHGVVRSTGELRTLWSELVNIQREVNLNLLARVPDPPVVDFDREMVLWFADRGAAASFTKAIELVATVPDTLRVVITVVHSDFGSRSLNLWTTARTSRALVFEVRHEYETRGP